MRVLLPEHLQAEWDAASDALRQHLSAMLTESIGDILEQFKTFRHVLLYFNTRADWDAILRIIHDTVRADAIQVVALEGLDDLSYHLLPPDQQVDEDVTNLLHDGLAIDDQSLDGVVRLGMLLAVNDDLLGVILVARHNGEAFSEYDRLLLANFADELAIALHNLELYGLIREQANRLANMIQQFRPDGSKKP
jgi:GAF domain-containing protein